MIYKLYVWIASFLAMTIRFTVIASSGHGKNPLQKRVMTIQVAVIASRAKQSRSPDDVRIKYFVIIRRCIEPAAVTELVEVLVSISRHRNKRRSNPEIKELF